jgi:hypothetical protein
MFQVKGVAYLARQAMVTAERGAPAWEQFLARFRASEPDFPAQVFPVTLIPGDLFIRFNERITRELYPNELASAVYWQAGLKSAEFAFANQLRGLFQPGDYARFLAFTPRVFHNYFDSGELLSRAVGPTVWELRIIGTPRHPYFEYSVMGFGSGALRLLGAAHPEPERLQQFEKGFDEVVYHFRID